MIKDDTNSSKESLQSESKKEIYVSSTPSILSSDKDKEDQNYYGHASLKDYRHKYFKSNKIIQRY